MLIMKITSNVSNVSHNEEKDMEEEIMKIEIGEVAFYHGEFYKGEILHHKKINVHFVAKKLKILIEYIINYNQIIFLLVPLELLVFYQI